MNKKKNVLCFEFIDNMYDDEILLERKFYPENECESLSLEDYYLFCKEFAAALGFAEKSINEWFGDY